MDETPPTTPPRSEPERKPAPRWRGRFVWMPAGIFFALVTLLLLTPFVLIRVDASRDWVLDRSLNGSVLADGVRLRMDRVARLDLGGFRFQGVELQRLDAEIWAPWLRVESLGASWRLLDVLAGQWTAEEIEVGAISLNIDETPNPLLASRKTSSRNSDFKLQLPTVRCRRIVLEEVAVSNANGNWLTGRLHLRDFSHVDGEIRIFLEEGTVRSIPDSLDLTLSSSWVEGALAKRLEVEQLRVAATGLDGELSASVTAAAAGSTSVLLEGELVFSKIEPTRIPPVRRMAMPWKTSDRFAGRLLFRGKFAPRQHPHADLVLSTSGQLFGGRVDTLNLNATASRSAVEVIGLDVRMGRQKLEGRGEWLPKRKSAHGVIEFTGLDVSSLPTAAFFADLPRSHLSGRLQGRADSILAGTEIDAEFRIEGGTLLDEPLGDVVAQLRMTPKHIWIDTLWTGLDQFPTMSAHGQIVRGDPAQIDLAGHFSDLPLETWVDPWIDQNLEGSVRGPFRVFGAPRELRGEASLEVSRGRVVEIFVDSLQVNAAGTVYPFALDTPFQAWGLDFYGFEVDSLFANSFLSDTLYVDAKAYRDTTLLVLGGRVLPADPGIAFIDELRAEPGRGPVVAMVHPTELKFSSRRVEVDSIRIEGSPGNVWASAWIEPHPGDSGKALFEFDVRAEGLNLGMLSQYFSLPPEAMSGNADVVASGNGRMDAPGYSVSIDATRAQVYGWLWERVRLDVDAGAIGARGQDADSWLGGADAVVSPGPGRLGLVRVDTLHATAHGYVNALPRLGQEQVGPEPPGPPLEINTEGVTVLLDRSWKRALGAVRNDSLLALLENARFRGDLVVDELPVAPILAPILVPQAKQGSQATFATDTVNPMLSKIRIERPIVDGTSARASGIGGRISFRVNVDGTGRDPSIRMQGRGDEVQVYQAWADSVRWTAQFVDSLLYIQKLDWTQDERGLRISGRVPLALSVDPAHTHWRSEPLWLEAEIPSVDLSLVSLATALIEDPSGNLFGRARLKGVPPNVYLEGDLTVNNGSFRIPLREEKLSHVEAHLKLDSLGVHIESARGRWNGSGTAEASGWYRDEDRFALKGKVRDALIFESGNYRFVADGDFEASPIAVGDSLRPQLRGTIKVQEGAITMDLAKPGRQSVLDTPWLIDLDVEVATDVRVIQPTSSVDLAGGQLQVHYDVPYWSLGGQLDIVEGQYLIFNKDLEITQGSIEFLDTGTGPYPLLDITAETEVGDPDGDQAIVIHIDVDGSPLPGESMDIVVSSPSHADYSQEDLIDLLTVGQLRSGDFASGSSSDPARGFLTGQVLNQLERELIREAPWLDMVHLRGGTDSSDPIVISLRAIREPQWSVKYSQELTTNPGREVAFSYRISDLFFLNAVADRREDEVGTANETYSLDLRLRFDY